MCIEEGERLSGIQRLHPKGDLAQLHRHRVRVDAVDAARHYVAQRVTNCLGGRLGVVLSYGGKAFGDAIGSSDKEVAGPASGVTYGEGEQCVLGVTALDGLVDDWI